MERENEKKGLSRREFINKAKGATALAYVTPVILTVSLNSKSHARDDGRSGGRRRRGNQGQGNSVSEVGGGNSGGGNS